MKQLNFKSITGVFLLATLLFFGACSKEKLVVQNIPDEITIDKDDSFVKKIKVADNDGNYIVYKISSNDLAIVNSYSSENFTLKCMTDTDLKKKLSIKNQKNTDDVNEDKDNFVFTKSNTITINAEIIEEYIDEKYATYEITEYWVAPEGYEEKGFDWHAMDKTTKNYASLTNNRCCWAIYYSFDIWEGNNVSRIEDNIKLKGRTTNSRIGRSYGPSDQAQLHIKFRKEKHYSFYYYD
jgi:hypothetical protein